MTRQERVARQQFGSAAPFHHAAMLQHYADIGDFQ